MQGDGILGFRLPESADIRADLVRTARIVVAAGLAWEISVLLGFKQPIFAVLVPLVAIQDDPYGSLNVSVARVVGVLGGVVVGLLALRFLGTPAAVTIVALLAVALVVGMLIRIGGSMNIQVAISALLIVTLGRSVPGYAMQRVWETSIGAGVCLVISVLVFPPDPLRELRAVLDRASTSLGEVLADAAELISHGGGGTSALHLRAAAEQASLMTAVSGLARIQRAMRVNPVRRDDRDLLATVSARIRLAERLAFHVSRLTFDIDAFLVRPEFDADWERISGVLPSIVAGVRVGIREALSGVDFSATIARMQADLDADRALDPGALATVLRRAIRAIVGELQAFNAGSTLPPAGPEPAPAVGEAGDYLQP